MNKTFLAAVVFAVLMVAGGLGLIWKFWPSMEEQKQEVLEGAFREGSPEYATLMRRIIAENDVENTWESPLGTGFLMMNIAGRIKNFSDKTLTGLEVKVAVVDQFDKTVKEKRVIVVPTQQATLEPQGVMNVIIRIEGFTRDDDRARIRWLVTAIKVK